MTPAPAPVGLPPEHSAASPLSIHDMTVAYHRRPVLWDVDLDLPEGCLIGLIGPNGAGKSTLIKAALDLVPTASGRVLVYGKPYREQRHLVGYVPLGFLAALGLTCFRAFMCEWCKGLLLS